MKRMMTADIIDKILAEPPRQYTKEEAERMLRNCGVLDGNNQVKPAYKDIFVPRANKNGRE